MIGRWRLRYRCKHHDWRTGQTWIESQLVDLGRRKVIWCTHCGKDFRWNR